MFVPFSSMLLLCGRPELEKVQRRFTKRLSGLSSMSYPDKLKTLSLPTLEGRRLTADLIFCYKIINGLFSVNPADFFLFRDLKTGRKQKLVVQHSRVDARQHFFLQQSCSSVELLMHVNMYSHLLLVCLEAI